MNKTLEGLIHNAKHAWASGALVSDADFQFVEDLWIIYNLDETLTSDQVRRLEQIDSRLGGGVVQGTRCLPGS